MVTGQAISAKAPHPNAAKLYQDYSLSEEGAALFQKWAGTPARTGLTDERDVAKLPWYKPPEALATFDPNKFTDSLKDLIATYKAAFGNR
jgi:ABC-type Fe3+ transport system substrate-binding protein